MFTLALGIATLAVCTIPVFAGHANSDVCLSTWSIGVGGYTMTGNPGTWETSEYITADQHVEYNSIDPASGVSVLGSLINRHRLECPSDHIKIVGHSEGAAIVHAWVTEHKQESNINAVLIADPKFLQGPGLSVVYNVWPLGGVDANFGNFPVLTVCNSDDMICDTKAGWMGYVAEGAHQRYDMNSFDYNNYSTGTVFH